MSSRNIIGSLGNPSDVVSFYRVFVIDIIHIIQRRLVSVPLKLIYNCLANVISMEEGIHELQYKRSIERHDGLLTK